MGMIPRERSTVIRLPVNMHVFQRIIQSSDEWPILYRENLLACLPHLTDSSFLCYRGNLYTRPKQVITATHAETYSIFQFAVGRTSLLSKSLELGVCLWIGELDG